MLLCVIGPSLPGLSMRTITTTLIGCCCVAVAAESALCPVVDVASGVVVSGGNWSHTSRIDGRLLFTTPYVITVHPSDPTRIDMAYKGMTTVLLYGVVRLDEASSLSSQVAPSSPI